MRAGREGRERQDLPQLAFVGVEFDAIFPQSVIPEIFIKIAVARVGGMGLEISNGTALIKIEFYNFGLLFFVVIQKLAVSFYFDLIIFLHESVGYAVPVILPPMRQFMREVTGMIILHRRAVW